MGKKKRRGGRGAAAGTGQSTQLQQQPPPPPTPATPAAPATILNPAAPTTTTTAPPPPSSPVVARIGHFAVPTFNSTFFTSFTPTPAPPASLTARKVGQVYTRLRGADQARFQAGFRDEITEPSAASGGIPDPTAEYFAGVSIPSQTLAEPRPLLVVLDLNGTLVYRDKQRRPPKIIPRTHAETFLRYCIDTFHVVIWSSARAHNVQLCCRRLLDPRAPPNKHPIAIWGREKFGLTTVDFNARVRCYKRLTRIWADPTVRSAHPHGLPWDHTNTVLIDDSPFKARSEPHNLLCIPLFEAKANEKPAVLPRVHDYLNTLAHQSNVGNYIRECPFDLDAAPDPDVAVNHPQPASAITAPGPTTSAVPTTAYTSSIPLMPFPPMARPIPRFSSRTTQPTPPAPLSSQNQSAWSSWIGG